MNPYEIVWGALAWAVTVAAFWPVNVALAGLSFRIWQGEKTVDMERDEFWWRSGYAATTIAAAALAFVVLDYVLVELAELPAGPVHLVVLIGFLATAAWAVYFMFSLEDFFQGMSLIVIYLFMPIVVLWPLNWLLGVWNPLLNLAYAWLREPPPA